MKHTTRMLLVPEEMYRSLLSKAPSAAASMATGAATATDALGITPTTTPIEHITKRMARVARTAQQPAARALMNDDERLIRYQQEYKRFKKLLADEQERPAPVRLNQLPNDPASKGVLRDALTEAAKTLQQPQQQTPPSLTKRRRRTAAAAATTAVPARAGVHSTPPVSPQPPAAATAAAPPQQPPERQQNKVTTGQKGKRKRTTTATTASSYTSAASGAEEEQQQIHQPQVASTSSSRGAVVVAGAQRLGEAEQRRKQQALDYTSRHAGTLGIGNGQQVYKFMKGAYRPIKNSSLQAPPPGYQTFIANAKQHPQLSHLLFPTSSTSSISGEGHGGGGGGGGRGGILTKRKSSNAAAVAITATRKARGKKIRGSGASSALLLHTFKKACAWKEADRVKNANKDNRNNSNNKNAEVQAQKRELLIEKVLDELYKDTRSNAAFTSVEPLLLGGTPDSTPGEASAGPRCVVIWPASASTPYTVGLSVVSVVCRRLPLKRHNRGHAYLLVCADTLSRQLFVEPVKSKRSSDIVQAFEKIFRRVGYMPWKLMTDQGKEFTAAPVATWHAGIAERAIRSIKERLYRYFTHRGAKCWTGVIQHIVTALNGSPNRALFGLRPNDINFGNAERVRRNQLERLDAGQQQRQSHAPDSLSGYLPRFTDELFTVAEVRTSRLPITYKLRDDDGELLTGWFYAQDLCLVLKPPPPLRSKRDEPIADKAGAADSATVGPVYDIERVLRRRRGRDGAERMLRGGQPYKLLSGAPATQTSVWLTMECGFGGVVVPALMALTGHNGRAICPRRMANRRTGAHPGAGQQCAKSYTTAEQLAPRTGRGHYHQLTGEAETSAKKEVERLLSLEQQQQTQEIRPNGLRKKKQQQQQKSDEMSQQQQQNEQKEEWKRTQFNAHYRRTLDTLVAERMEEAERNLLNKHLPLGLELWVQSYRKARLSCRFSFDVEQQRFRLQIDPVRIKQVELSEQLAYILGFHTRHLAGVSSFYVYAPGLIEPVIIGDVCVPVLRMVCIRSAQPDDMVEEAYTAVQYHQLITKEIAEIFIEIRTPTGALMPFQYGTCTLTLHFRKTPYF
ncbi:hypothetical protein niasHT_039247 [Heterodera trifolii]|uniref:Integrase catalytic domain-containing protein n=1 Tax=Heterodera trifolii TaxID=157864 RepID=A0ABD2J1R2_9BILA